MKAMKRLVCALLALTCAFAFCACGEGHPMYKDFTFTRLSGKTASAPDCKWKSRT